jgi:hypothetical protein
MDALKSRLRRLWAIVTGARSPEIRVPLVLRGAWQEVDGGTTRGIRGSENGRIILDEKYEGAARITLEKGGRTSPFAITCGVYGWMVHTRFFGDGLEAARAFDDMKVGLAEIVRLETMNEGEDEADVVRRVSDAIDMFVERYP